MRRASASARGYTSPQWKRLRRTILERDGYLCQACIEGGAVTQARDVDHIIPKAKGGTDEPGNLQALCHSCHSEKTMRESVGTRRKAHHG